MNSIDIFVLPSFWEGFGYVLVEAMACSKPIVAFDLSSNPEIIDRDKTGFLIKPFDTKAMTDTLEHLATDHTLRVSMGKAGRQRVQEHFTINTVCEKLIQVLFEVGSTLNTKH
jgi:glycosyltransferase involved in cell wall biosynthesis